jgi:hypothetical protein
MGQPFVYEQKPSSGKHYLIVDVTVENIGSSPETISSLLQMKLQDSRGYAYTPDIMTVTFLDMPFGGEMGGGGGELSPGQKMRGEVAFQVSDSATGLQFIFDYEFFGLGQAIVDLET